MERLPCQFTLRGRRPSLAAVSSEPRPTLATLQPRRYRPVMADSPLTADDVRKVGKLARLRLTDDEVEAYRGQLGDILGYVERLQAVDTDGVELMAHPADAVATPREDVVRPGLSRDAALSNAPQTDGECFLVPKILDGDS